MRKDQPIAERPERSLVHDEFDLLGLKEPFAPIYPPILLHLSGLYERSQAYPVPFPLPQMPPRIPIPTPKLDLGTAGTMEELRMEFFAAPELGIPTVPKLRLFKEQLRLDVDGSHPQMMASGTLSYSLSATVNWVANLAAVPGGWTGTIFYKDDPSGLMHHTNVAIQVSHTLFPASRVATATFYGGGAPSVIRPFKFKSFAFRDVEFEFDCEQGITPVTTYYTCAHPDRPQTLTCEALTIDNVYRRTGFAVTHSGGENVVPTPVNGPAQAHGTWSDTELHDAMETYWSRFANKAQWAAWVFFGRQHDMGPSLGGIMFDDIGPNERQGTAIFYDSFISQAPAGEAHPGDWVDRMRFWTAVHEMGHVFNLAHSWEKAFPTPWVPLQNEPEARSFMNYPFRVPGGTPAFFKTFEYRFSDHELQFLRHAPERFVEPGNADWFDNHGFRNANTTPEPTYKLILRVNRDKPVFDFLEPAMIEAKLMNISGQPQIVDANLLDCGAGLTLIVKRDGMPAREWTPEARYCRTPQPRVLNDGEAIYDAVFAGMGRGGWYIADPGMYTLQASVTIDEMDYVSEPLRIRVTPPKGYDDAYRAQEFFSKEVGKALTFDGTAVMEGALNVMHEVATRFADRPVANHVQVALGKPLAKQYKTLSIPGTGPMPMDSVGKLESKFEIRKAKPEEARKAFDTALTKNPTRAADTLGHIEYKMYVDEVSDWLAKEGEHKDAAALLGTLHTTLAKRGVLKSVLNDIELKQKAVLR